jgi:hypothetical protein
VISLTHRRVAAVALAAALATGFVSVALGQDQNFDQLNYHYYVGYAFLHGRLQTDIVPSGIQTYLSPLLNALHYLGMAHLPPRVFGFALGVLHGLNIPLLLALALVVSDQSGRAALALLAAVVGVMGPDAVSLIGTTFGDNLVTLPALAGMALTFAWDKDNGRGPHWLLAAGLGMGLATGLKLTMGIYVVALLVALLLLPRAAGRRLRAASWFLVGAAAGFLPSGGLWAWRLYEWFGNPLFPLANGLFRSEYFAPASFVNALYTTRSLGDLLRPFVNTALGRPEHLQEVTLRDFRLTLLLLAALAWLFSWVWSLRRGSTMRALAGRERAFLVFWLVAYLLWAFAFPYYRYFALLEFTCPLALLVLGHRLLPARALAPTCAAVALALAVTTHAGSWGRRPWQHDWLAMPVPPLGLQRGALVMLVGQPIAYAIPSFRDDARFVHLTAVDRFGADAKWHERIRAAIDGHRGPLLLLSNFEFSRATVEARAAAFGLRVSGSCEPVRRPPLRLRLCPLAHVQEGP